MEVHGHAELLEGIPGQEVLDLLHTRPATHTHSSSNSSRSIKEVVVLIISIGLINNPESQAKYTSTSVSLLGRDNLISVIPF